MRDYTTSPIVGRPTKYRPEMCEIVIEEMKEGASKCEVAAILEIGEDTFYRWLKEDDKSEFQEAVKLGSSYSKAWWYKQGRTKLSSKEFSPTLWYMNMKNRHGWSDKQEHKVDANLSYIDLLNKIKEEEENQS